MLIRFTALGTPVPKGSAKGFIVKTRSGPRAVVTHDNKGTKSWGSTVAEAALAARDAAVANWTPVFPPGVPIGLAILFRLPRPKNAPPHKVAHQLKKPDLDKLVRAVKDALVVAGVYTDDNAVVLVAAGKVFPGALRSFGAPPRSSADFLPGVDVIVGPLGEMLPVFPAATASEPAGACSPFSAVVACLEFVDRVGLEETPPRTRKARATPAP